MRLFGLTGGIGMGKSTASGLMAEFGLSVIDTDIIARELVLPGQPALAEITAVFGSGMLDDEGLLRRGVLGELVFADARARRRLEGILHPRIREVWQTRVAGWATDGVQTAVVVIPLLFETDAAGSFDATVCVACLEETQQRRLASRGWSAREISRRVQAQFPVAEKIALSSHVLWNEGNREVLKAQIRRVLA